MTTRLGSGGASTIIIVVVVIVSAVGLIAIYSTLGEPIQEYKNEIKDRMETHTGPIDNFWLIFKVAGAAMFLVVLLWAILAGQEEEYESQRTQVPL